MSSNQDAAMVIVRDPARAGRKPISPNVWTFLTWLLEGALLALVAGGAAALFGEDVARFHGGREGERLIEIKIRIMNCGDYFCIISMSSPIALCRRARATE